MDEKALRSILGRLGLRKFVKSRNWLNCPCPLAEWTHRKGRDNNPSFGVLIDPDGISHYKCYSCKHTGRVSTLVRQLAHFRGVSYSGLDTEADIADLTVTFGEYDDVAVEDRKAPEPLNEAAYGDLYSRAWRYSEAKEYLLERGISKETSLDLGLGYDETERRIIFPVRGFGGELYGFTGRSILQEEDYPRGGKGYPKIRDYSGLPKRALLLGAERAEHGYPMLVVEGLFGYGNLIEQGVEELCNVIALLGSEMTPEKAELLIEFDEPVYLLLDDDEGGDVGLFGAQVQGKHRGGGAIDKLCGHLPLFVPEWPDGKNDPDQLTFEDIEIMLRDTPLWGIDKKTYTG